MAHASWGGPGVASKDLVRLTGINGLPTNVHKDVAVIHQYLANELKKLRQKKGVPPLESAGAYNKRYIANTTTWSNHAWGLAVDYNPGANPYSYNGKTDFPVAETRALVASLEGMRWGWDYSGKKDAMHFEWVGSRELAAKVTARLLKGGPVASNDFSTTASGPKVLEVETRLRLMGFLNTPPSDKFTENTKGAVKAFQMVAFPGQPNEHDGIVGTKTLTALDNFALKLPKTGEKSIKGILQRGWILSPGQSLVSENDRHQLAMQTDGNFVLYNDNKPVWQTGIRFCFASLNPDGNLVGYLQAPGGLAIPVWQTGTANAGLEMELAMQDDGNLVLYGKRAFWHVKG